LACGTPPCLLFALPRAKPTCPLPSPTTTSPLKLNRRPPFTTFATRLMWTTFSFNSVPCASVMMRRGPPPERSCAIRPFLELQPALARPVGDGTDSAVIEEPVAIENDPLDALLEAAARRGQPDLLGRADVRRLLQVPARGGRQRRDGERGLAGAVRHHLQVDVTATAVDGEPRALLGAAAPPADAGPAPVPSDRLLARAHQRAPPAAALPALRR